MEKPTYITIASTGMASENIKHLLIEVKQIKTRDCPAKTCYSR